MYTLIGLGVGLAFLAEYLDDKVNTTEDVGRFGHGVTVLAEIPAHTAWRDGRDTHVVSLEDPNAPQAEAYRSLRTALLLLLAANIAYYFIFRELWGSSRPLYQTALFAGLCCFLDSSASRS